MFDISDAWRLNASRIKIVQVWRSEKLLKLQ